MESTAAAEVARLLLSKNGLLDMGWNYRVVPYLGGVARCVYQTRLVEVNASEIQGANPYEFEQVMLHEIAHALAPGDGHGEQWRRMCISIGAPCWAMVWRRGHNNAWLSGPGFFEPTRGSCLSTTSAVAYIHRTLKSEDACGVRHFWFRTPRYQVGLWVDPYNRWFVTTGARAPQAMHRMKDAIEEAAMWLWMGFRTDADGNRNLIAESELSPAEEVAND
jgi:hypothetical protein